MISELEPSLDPSITRRFGSLADDASVKRSTAALEANGIKVLRAANAAEAKEIVLGLIPDGRRYITAHRNRLRCQASSTRSKIRVVTSTFGPSWGAWTARPRVTRYAALPRRLT